MCYENLLYRYCFAKCQRYFGADKIFGHLIVDSDAFVVSYINMSMIKCSNRVYLSAIEIDDDKLIDTTVL